MKLGNQLLKQPVLPNEPNKRQTIPTRTEASQIRKRLGATPSPLNGEKAGPSPRRSGTVVRCSQGGFGRAGGMWGEAVRLAGVRR